MSRVLYFDCFSGISGDLALGALLDAGLPLADLKGALGSLALGDCQRARLREGFYNNVVRRMCAAACEGSLYHLH